jgi:hypothetical protein
MALSKKYPTASPALANYSYEDIASGLGYINFYLYNAHVDSTPTTAYKIIDNNSIYSNYINTIGTGTRSTTFTNTDNYTFDSTPFSITRTAKGTATVNVTTGGSGTSSYVGSGRVLVSLFRYDGTETQLGDTVMSREAGGNLTPIYATGCLSFTISETIFKVGDILRVKVALYAKTSNGSADGRGIFCHDPINRTVVNAETSQFIVKLPFKVDI